MKKRICILLCAAMAFFVIVGCGGSTQAQSKGSVDAPETAKVEEMTTTDTGLETWEVDLDMIDMTKWQYDSGTDVYWQVGISYCANPADEEYETLGIFVPGAYMDAADNGDGTYTCTVNKQSEVNGYTSETAPI